MSAAVDLSGSIASAIDGAYARGFPMSVAHVGQGGRPSLSLRGSVLVLGRTEIGFWARKRDTGIAKDIGYNAEMALLFFGDMPDGSRMRVLLNGRARVDPARNAEVYERMGEVEQRYDAEGKGVAIIVEIHTVSGMTADGPFTQG